MRAFGNIVCNSLISMYPSSTSAYPGKAKLFPLCTPLHFWILWASLVLPIINLFFKFRNIWLFKGVLCFSWQSHPHAAAQSELAEVKQLYQEEILEKGNLKQKLMEESQSSLVKVCFHFCMQPWSSQFEHLGVHWGSSQVHDCLLSSLLF